MIGWLLRLVGLRKRRRRVYVQSPVPPAPPVRRRHKGEAAMPLPPGYVQKRGEPAQPPAPLPKRRFGPSSMPAPPGQLQGPSLAAATDTGPSLAAEAARDAEARTQARRAAREAGREAGRNSPVALARLLEQPNVTARRSRRAEAEPVSAPRPAPAARAWRWSPMPGLRARWAKWRRPLWRTGRFGVLYVLPVAVVAVVGALVLREMRHVGVVVMPISVPAEIAASGRTPAVLAAHLIDQVDQVRLMTLADRDDRPDDAIGPAPPVGAPPPLLSRRGIAGYLRDLFAAPVQRVTGDVVRRPDGMFSLRLHMTGAGEIASQDGITAEQIDPAIRYVAAEVWRVADPTLYAWYKSEMEPRPIVVAATMRSLLRDPSTGQTMADPAARQTILMLLARALVGSGDPRGAVDTLDAMGQPGRLYAPAWAVRATALLDLGQGVEATDAQARVLALAPNSAWAHVSTARLYMGLGRYSDAYQQARAARRLAPENGAAAILESAALIALQRVPEAVLVARQAIQFAPAQPGVREQLGNALLVSRRPDLALGLYDSELKLHPGRETALIGRARALQSLGRNEEALAATELALQSVPNNGTALLLRAWTLLAVKRPQDSLAGFDALLRSRPDMPVLLQGRAEALAALGRTADALVVLQRLNTLVPNNAQVEAEIKRLKSPAK